MSIKVKKLTGQPLVGWPVTKTLREFYLGIELGGYQQLPGSLPFDLTTSVVGILVRILGAAVGRWVVGGGGISRLLVPSFFDW